MPESNVQRAVREKNGAIAASVTDGSARAAVGVDGFALQIDGGFASAFIRARKPAPTEVERACCGPTCCA
jgi:hypothetical protein